MMNLQITNPADDHRLQGESWVTPYDQHKPSPHDCLVAFGHEVLQ